MKNVLVCLLLLTAFTSHSQLVRNKVLVQTANYPYMANGNARTYKPAFINNISAGIISHFTNLFPNSPDVEWFANDKEVLAYVRNENAAVRYKVNGYYISTRKTYKEDQLILEVSDFIKENFPLFIINLVTEISRGDRKVYEISLRNRNKWCIVRIFSDEASTELEIIDQKTFINADHEVDLQPAVQLNK